MTIMKSLRLVFDNANGERKDIALPMEKWISDWWYECKIVPPNDTTILIAELDGKSVLEEINAVDERYKTFEEIAWYFNWDGLYHDFTGIVKGNLIVKDSQKDFEEWLNERE